MPGKKSIVYYPEGKAYSDPMGTFFRNPAATAELVAGQGISGDQKAGRNKTRLLSILTFDWFKQAVAAGYQPAPGAVDEQIALVGLMLNNRKSGERLALGENAVIELTSARTGCRRLETAQGKTITPEMKKAVGFMARYITRGKIRAGEEVNQVDMASVK